MADVWESLVDNKLGLADVVDDQITHQIEKLYIIMQMLPEDQQTAKDLIENVRNDLVRIRYKVCDFLEERKEE